MSLANLKTPLRTGIITLFLDMLHINGKLQHEKVRIGVKNSPKILLTTIHYITLIYHKGGLGTAKLFMGVAVDDVRVNIKGGTTHNRSNPSKVLHLFVQILSQPTIIIIIIW